MSQRQSRFTRVRKFNHKQEMELAAKYFAVSNQGHEPSKFTPFGIESKYAEISEAIAWELGVKEGLEKERKLFLKDLKKGPGQDVYDEWQKIVLDLEGFERV